jgi:hypothetical protein
MTPRPKKEAIGLNPIRVRVQLAIDNEAKAIK